MNVMNHIEIIFPKGGFPEKAAEEIRKKLIEYKPPKDVVRKTGKKGICDIDEDWLIVVCGPAAQDDPEVTKCVNEYIQAGKRERILALLAEGHSKDSFPKELYYEILPDGSRMDREPLGANITAESEKKALRNIEVEKLRLLAPMLGVAFDDLLNRKRKQRRLVISAILAAAVFSSLVFLGFAVYKISTISGQNKKLSGELKKAEEAKNNAENQRDAAMKSLAESAAMKAKDALNEGDSELALLITLEFLPTAKDSEALNSVFEEALSARCKAGYVPLTTARAYNRDHPDEDESDVDSYFKDAGERYGIVDREKNPLGPEEEKIVDGSELNITDYQYAFGFEDRIIGMAKEGVCVYNKEPFEYMYTLCDEHTMNTESCAPNGTTYWNSFFTAALPNGERRFLVDYQYVYDAETGEFLYEIEDNGQYIGVSRDFLQLSSEGYLPLRIGDSLHLIDLTDGHDAGIIKDTVRDEFTLMGENDSVSGRTSASIISMHNYFGQADPMIWIWNEEEIPVPESPEARIELAEKLLNGRKLTEKEKRENYLE